MDCPDLYVKENGMQRSSVKDVSSKYIGKMIWKPNEIVIDIGCGPGDVTSDILYPILQTKIKQLVGVDKSKQMVDYAQKTYGCSDIDFKVLDIENTNDCASYSYKFNKIFSFFCFHWVHNQFDALINMHSMLKIGGEILVEFVLINPIFELYKCMDVEWKKYIDAIQNLQTLHSQDEVKAIFIEAGFRIINMESSIKKYTFPDLTAVLNAVKPVDDMYNVLPPHLHDKYSAHVKETICERKFVDICPDTGKTTNSYLPITVHAIRD